MSSVFRRESEPSIEVTESWSLDEQISDVSEWLDQSNNAALVRGSVLDIGFNYRIDGRAVAVQGETVPLEFMRRLVGLDITLWLSIYPPSSDKTDPAS